MRPDRTGIFNYWNTGTADDANTPNIREDRGSYVIYDSAPGPEALGVHHRCVDRHGHSPHDWQLPGRAGAQGDRGNGHDGLHALRNLAARGHVERPQERRRR